MRQGSSETRTRPYRHTVVRVVVPVGTRIYDLEVMMRRAILVAITVAGIGVPLITGTAIAAADDDDRRSSLAASTGAFEIEIDPELDARFGPRPVNAVRAAEIVTNQFPGARVTEAELDEVGGGPIWEVKFELGGGENEVNVDAVTGAIFGDDDDGDGDDGDGGDDDGGDDDGGDDD